MSAEAADNNSSAITGSTEAKDTPKQPENSSMFDKMFKNKTKPASPPSEANVAAEAPLVSAVETENQKSNPSPVSVEANNIQANTAVSVEATGTQISATAESNTPAQDTPKPEISNMFNKMFKRKTELKLVSPSSEELNVSAVDSQESNPSPASVEANNIQANTVVSVEATGPQISATAESNTPAQDTPKQPEISNMFNKMFKRKTEPKLVSPSSEELNVSAVDSQESNTSPAPAEANGTHASAAVSVEAACNQISARAESPDSNTPVKDTPNQPETSSMFNMMFKKKTRPVSSASEANIAAKEQIVSSVETPNQKPNPAPASVEANGTLAVSVDGAVNHVSAEQTISAEDSTLTKDTPKQPEIHSMFKMFKKKTVTPAPEANVAAEEPMVSAVDSQNQKSEPTDIKANPEAEKVPQGEASSLRQTEVTQDSTQPEQDSVEEKTVMNFFKTFVSSTKTTKEATASPDVSKDQVPEASKIPPPPPPAPPKVEIKAEPAVKKDEAPPIDAAAGTAKQAENSNKIKSKSSSFSKLFRPKVDASKTSTLEAGAKAEPPPAPKPEEKKAQKKSSFANLLKPKATEPKKDAAAAAAATAEVAASTKPKDEPKPAAPAAPAAASPDNKSVGSTDNSSPSTSRKLEKRNSIQLFFKNLVK
ncbi:hypothetical protein Baya_6558 [Bagarius yarrelli]|uniref:Breast carcinoma-amplified sequence 1 n=1 Tax=Bagarius yarrelli TaxID=175774 RepID=A0A556U0K2_BAGYA|nr:hypothetical protein Baya_6558 [Bagarius yarrelli]